MPRFTHAAAQAAARRLPGRQRALRRGTLLLLATLLFFRANPTTAQTPIADGWPSYTLETVRIEGNEDTEDQLILDAAGLPPGIRLEEARLELARDHILALGLFRQVSFRLVRGSSTGLVVLVVTVVERPSLMITDLFLGWTEPSPFYVGGGVADTNFLGRNLVAGLAGVLGGDGRGALRLDLRDPALIGSRTIGAIRLAAISGTEVNCAAWLGGCAEGELDRVRYRRLQGRLLFGRPVGRRLHLYLAYRFEALQTRRELGALRQGGGTWAEPHLPVLPEGNSVLSVVSAVLELDTRDDPFIATRGLQLRLSAEVSSPLAFSDYDYSRFRIDAAWHTRAFADHTLSLHGFLGLVQGTSPFFERFHVADHSYFTVGANTVPRALEVSFTEVFQYDPILVTAGADYQIPVFEGGRFFYRGYVYLAAQVTLSAANTGQSLFELSRDPRNEISRFPLSGDLGLRVDTAIGLFSLGLSYPLDLVF